MAESVVIRDGPWWKGAQHVRLVETDDGGLIALGGVRFPKEGGPTATRECWRLEPGGKRWEKCTPAPEGELRSVAYKDGSVWIVLQGSPARVFSRADGEDEWIAQALPPELEGVATLRSVMNGPVYLAGPTKAGTGVWTLESDGWRAYAILETPIEGFAFAPLANGMIALWGTRDPPVRSVLSAHVIEPGKDARRLSLRLDTKLGMGGLQAQLGGWKDFLWQGIGRGDESFIVDVRSRDRTGERHKLKRQIVGVNARDGRLLRIAGTAPKLLLNRSLARLADGSVVARDPDGLWRLGDKPQWERIYKERISSFVALRDGAVFVIPVED